MSAVAYAEVPRINTVDSFLTCMDFLATVKRVLGLGDDDEPTYICIRCGGTFERDYRECPECGKPYVARDE